MANEKKLPNEGKIFLVGAGPGDLGLVTLRAQELLKGADVVVYDHLANPEMLRWTRAGAEIVYAGKEAGDHALSQAQINELLVEKARAGRAVVRLKGGDPFLFGRGGEEALAAVEAGVPFEVVPGVSSAIAGPAYAGIPVTHRGENSHVTFFTGHEDPAKKTSAIDFAALAKLGGTQVMLMGLERLGEIARTLREQGVRSDLPAAVIRWASTGRQQTIVGTMETIASQVAAEGFSPPAIVIFGEVVSLREKLNWFEQRPLRGKRIVVTRSRKQAGELSSWLDRLGADVLELPTIKTEPPADLREFAELVQDSHSYDWLVFTSPNGVSAFFEMFYKLYDDARSIGGVRIAVIGPATAQRVRDFHLKVDLQPEEFVAESLVAAFQKNESVDNQRFLLVRADKARDVLPQELSRLGAIVDQGIAYRTVPETADLTGARARFVRDGADLITFTSSSTVENFMAMNLPWPKQMRVASIGPITSATARSRGLKVDVEAKQHDVPGLVNAISNFFGAGKKAS